YRGVIKWLVQNHIPFDTVVRPEADELSRYKVVIAPSLAAIGDDDAKSLDQYVAKGGHLVVTGPNPTALDQFGNQRAGPILKSLFRRGGRRSSGPNLGTAVHTAELVGETYLKSGSPASSRAIRELIGNRSHSPIETNADKSVHVELRTLGDELLLHLIN